MPLLPLPPLHLLLASCRLPRVPLRLPLLMRLQSLAPPLSRPALPLPPQPQLPALPQSRPATRRCLRLRQYSRRTMLSPLPMLRYWQRRRLSKLLCPQRLSLLPALLRLRRWLLRLLPRLLPALRLPLLPLRPLSPVWLRLLPPAWLPLLRLTRPLRRRQHLIMQHRLLRRHR